MLAAEKIDLTKRIRGHSFTEKILQPGPRKHLLVAHKSREKGCHLLLERGEVKVMAFVQFVQGIASEVRGSTTGLHANLQPFHASILSTEHLHLCRNVGSHLKQEMLRHELGCVASQQKGRNEKVSHMDSHGKSMGRKGAYSSHDLNQCK